MSMAFEMLRRHEGFRALPYLGSVGKLTVGYGHNLTEPMSVELGYTVLQDDIRVATRELIKIFSTFPEFGERRGSALIDMMVNLGAVKFIGFKKLIAAIRRNDWKEAALEAKDSKWYGQVNDNGRGDEVVSLLR